MKKTIKEDVHSVSENISKKHDLKEGCIEIIISSLLKYFESKSDVTHFDFSFEGTYYGNFIEKDLLEFAKSEGFDIDKYVVGKTIT